MAEHLKSASILEAELKAKIERLESELAAAWSTPIVGVCMFIVFILGILIGSI